MFQDLTNQLIELEKHFNGIELNKFGEHGVHAGKRSTQSRYGPSRYVRCTTWGMYDEDRWMDLLSLEMSPCCLSTVSIMIYWGGVFFLRYQLPPNFTISTH